MGPLPEVDQLILKALQTYSDGDVVRWIDEPTADVELEHPAPVLKLAKASDNASETASDDGGNGWAVSLGLAGVVLGLAGLVIGLLAYRRAATR